MLNHMYIANNEPFVTYKNGDFWFSEYTYLNFFTSTK